MLTHLSICQLLFQISSFHLLPKDKGYCTRRCFADKFNLWAEVCLCLKHSFICLVRNAALHVGIVSMHPKPASSSAGQARTGLADLLAVPKYGQSHRVEVEYVLVDSGACRVEDKCMRTAKTAKDFYAKPKPNMGRGVKKMSQMYDVQQVCENGHQMADCYNIYPEKRKKFCQECGATTLTACLCCGTEIQGARIKIGQIWDDAELGLRRMIRADPFAVDVPSYCPNCGEPYPWTQKRIRAAIQILAEFGDLGEEEKKTIDQDVENIAKDVPDAELSARRIKRIWERGKDVGYEIIMEFASRTAAKILKGP